MNSSQKDLAVFDFNEEEAAVEEAAGRLAARLQSRLRQSMEDAVNKYHFLEAYSSGLTLKHDISGILCINRDERENASGPYAIDISERDQALSYEKGELEETMASPTTFVEHNQAVDVVSEDDENWSTRTMSQSSTSTDTADEEGCLDCPEIEICYAESGDELNNQMEVIIFPEYLIHGSILYGESQLAFSVDSVKIECSDASGSVNLFATRWAVADIVHIDCRWSESVASALVKLCFRANDATKRQKDDNDFDVFSVMFSVSDMRWPEIEKSIRNLAPRYNDIWNINSGDMLWEGSVGSHAFLSKGNVPEIADFFEDVIYPKGDPDAVSISKRDFDLLQPETFINDTIIDFYIKRVIMVKKALDPVTLLYLKDNIHPDQKHRYHFFNSFFFRKLADLDKDRGSVSEGRAAFLRVRKWTRKVNIFEKDYIFIPVNFNLHWSLLVICHPGEVANMKDDIIDSDKVPCILHMDSIKGSHTGLKNIIQSYIWEEWKERHPQVTADDSSKFLNLRFVSLELPQQENSFDCGLFLLHYVELFLEEAPMNFDPFKITKFSSFLSADWFPPSEASIKRSVIRKLIYNLLNDSCKKTSPSTSSNGHPSASVYPENDIEQVHHIELLSVHYSPAKNVMGDALCPDAEDGIELLRSSSSAHFDKEGLILPEFLEQTAHTMSLAENGEHVHMRNATSSKLLFASCPTEELAGESGHLCCLRMEKEVCRSLNGKLDTQLCTTSYPDVTGTLVTPWDTVEEKDDELELASECTNAHRISVIKGGDIEKMRTSPDNFCYVPETPTTCSGDKVDDYVEDSQETGTSEEESNDCEDSRTTCAMEADCKVVDDKEINTYACEVDDVCEVRNAIRTEYGYGVELATNENEGEDQEATSGAVRLDDNDHAICSAEVISGDTICQENIPSSFQGIIVADEDNFLDAVQVANKRLQANKRRKIMSHEGTRMRTRSLTRESHIDN